MSFDDLNITQLRKIIREYNLLTKITLSVKGVKRTREELIAEIKKHLYIDDGGFIKFLENKATINNPVNKIDKEKEIKKMKETLEVAINKTNQKLNKDKKIKADKTYKKFVKVFEEEVKKEVEKEVEKEQPKEESIDELSNKLTQKIFISDYPKIVKALNKLNFRGRLQTNKMLLALQISQNFNTKEKIKKLLDELEDKKAEQPKEEYEEESEVEESDVEESPKKLFEDIKDITNDEYELALYLSDLNPKTDRSAILSGVMEAKNRFNRKDLNLLNYDEYVEKIIMRYKKPKKDKLTLGEEFKKEVETLLKKKQKELKKEQKDFNKKGLSQQAKQMTKLNIEELENEIEDLKNKLGLSGSGKPYGLHAVIIKKPYNLEDAKQKAQEFIKDKKKKYYRETSASYRFRNISKQKFKPKTFRTKKINNEISLIFGELKPEHSHLSGSGFFDFFKKGVEKVKEFFSPRLDGYSNTSKKTLEQYGNLPIKSLTIYRTPISGLIDKALNLISFGKFAELKKQYGFDKLFHLALVANVGNKNIIIEKNEVVNISTEYKTSKDTETFTIDMKGQTFTVNEMLDKARKNVGDKTFFDYDAFKNNCQFFIRYCLEAVGLYTEPAKNFLFQDVEGIYKGLPSYVSKIAKGITTTGAVASKIFGRGSEQLQGGQSMFDGLEKIIEQMTPIYNKGLVKQEGEKVVSSSRVPPIKILAEMSDKSYERERNIPGYELLKQTQTLSFYKKDDNIFIVFRGTDTEDMSDLIADLGIALGNLSKSVRYKEDYKAITDFQKQYPKSQYYYIGVGHSLGGALVDKFLNLGKLDEGVSFNPAVEKADYNKNNNNRRIYLSSDPLYKIMGSFTKYHEVRPSNLEIGPAHSISNFLGGRIKKNKI